MIDHIQPLLLNISTEGKSWTEHGIKASQVLRRNEWIKDISPCIYKQISEWVVQGIEKGWLIQENAK